MTHSRNEGRWSAVPAIGGLTAALLILSSCAREASSPVSPEAAVVASSIQSAAANKAAGFLLTVSLEGTGNGMVKSSPNGIACGGSVNKGGNGGNGGNCNGVFSGEVTLTATGIGGSTFTGWSGDACDGGSTPTTCKVTVDAVKNVTAHFSKGVVIYYTLTVNATGAGSVTSSVGGIACPGTCSASFVAGTDVTLTGAFVPGVSTFAGWTGGGCSGTSPCLLTMDGSKTVGAAFDAIISQGSLTLTVSAVGGSGYFSNSLNSDYCAVADGCVDYVWQFSESTVTLTAHAAAGFAFTGWTGACTGTVVDCTVTLDGASVTATFSAVLGPTFTVDGGGAVAAGQPSTLSTSIAQHR